jgi:transposase
MIHLPASVRVYLCLTACDMRKSFDGLHALVREHLELDAFAGHLFVFTSRRRDRVKILYWGPGRIRGVEQALRGWHVRGAVRRQR